jgi:SlyX protein
MTTDAERIAELEIRLAHQEATVDELSSVVAGYSKLLDQLREHLRRMTDRISEVEEAVPGKPQDDPPPPHY